MPKYTIEYSDQETLPDDIEREAEKLGLKPEQLIKRFIIDGMKNTANDEPAIPGTCLTDFLQKNGVIK